jgi:hypothetical protein
MSSILQRLQNALTTLTTQNQADLDGRMERPSLTEAEEEWGDDEGNPTELALLLEKLEEEGDPDAAYATWLKKKTSLAVKATSLLERIEKAENGGLSISVA